MFARTERLLLRPGWEEDAPALAHAIGEEAIVRNLARAPWPYRIEHARAFLAKERRPHDASLLVFRRTNGAPQLIGSVGLGRDPDGVVELGYWIARPHWGLGYATEAARAVVELARDAFRLRRLRAGHFLDNPASGRVLAKLGFRPMGIRQRHSVGRGHAAPCKLHELALGDCRAVDDQAYEPACRMIAA